MLSGSQPVILPAFKNPVNLQEAGKNPGDILLHKVCSVFRAAFWNDAALSFTDGRLGRVLGEAGSSKIRLGNVIQRLSAFLLSLMVYSKPGWRR